MAKPQEPIRYLGDVHRLKLGPDDVLVLRTMLPMTDEAMERLEARVQKTIGPDRKVLILQNVVEVGALASAAEV